MPNTNVPATINSRQHQPFTVAITDKDNVPDTTSLMTATSSNGAATVTLNADNRSGMVSGVVPGSSNIQLLVTGPNSQGVFINATVTAAPDLRSMVVTLGAVVGQ